MTPPRLVLVSRRFWPLIGGAEMAMANLASGLCESGCQVTLLTAQWDAAWPAEVVHRGVRVVRLPQSSLRIIGTWRYMRAIEGWLRAHRDEFDLVYVSMLKHDAYAAIGAARELGFPVVLRAEGAGVTGDVHWQLDARFGRRIRRRCYRAAAIVAPSDAIERELIAAGYPRSLLQRIANAVPFPAPRTDAARNEARAALAAAHPLLAMSQGAPIAVYTGRLHPFKCLDVLIDAWRIVAAKRPDARLWIVGEGPERARLWQQIADAGLDGRVVLAGAYDTVDDFLAAADLFVLPSREEGMSISLLEAMAAGLPVAASDIPGNRALVEQEAEGLLTPVGDAGQLAAAIDRLFGERELAERLGAAGRRRVEREFSLSSMVEAHRELFARLIHKLETPNPPLT